MSERVGTLVKIASGLVLSAAAAGGSAYGAYEIRPDAFSPTNREGALKELNLTEEQLAALTKAQKSVHDARITLEYTPPNTKCSIIFGFSTGCDPEKFPDLQTSLKRLETAQDSLTTSGKHEETRGLITTIDESLKSSAQSQNNPFGPRIDNSTYSTQRQILNTMENELSAENQNNASYIKSRSKADKGKSQVLALLVGVSTISTLVAICFGANLAKKLIRRPEHSPKVPSAAN